MNIDALAIRRELGRDCWRAAAPFPSTEEHHGWVIRHATENAQVIVTEAQFPDRFNPRGLITWWHASMTRPVVPPSYADLVLLHRAVFGERFAYQVFAPTDQHVNIHPRALHLWGREDGKAVTPLAETIGGRLSV